jgi:hypothetical protein
MITKEHCLTKKILLTFALIAAVSLGTAFAQTGLSASPAHSYILSMAESGGSVYLAGRYNDGYKDIACYWQDGIKTNLPAGNGYSYAAAITASSGSIYIAGNYSDGSRNIACYRKDGVKTDLPAPDGTTDSFARAISVINNAVYIAGFYENGRRNTACYWRNGARTDLPAPDGPFEIATARAPVVIPITITITGIDTVKYGGWDCGVYLYGK